MFTVLSGPVSRVRTKHSAFQNSQMFAMIQGDDLFPGEDRVHMLGADVVAEKAGLL